MSDKQKVTYPAVFYYEADSERVHVRFPDLMKLGGYTDGDDFEDAVLMAEDVLELIVAVAEEKNRTLPQPSRLEKVNIDFWGDDDKDGFEYTKIVIQNVSV